MSYSALYIKKSRKTLIVLGVISLILTVASMVMFVGQLGRENGWQTIRGIDRIMMVNRAPHGFEIVWTTNNKEKENQWVEWGTKLGIYTGKTNDEITNGVHTATVVGLLQDTTYYYRIRTGTKTYLLGALATESIHTPKEVRELPVSPAYGKIILPKGTPYANGLLTYEIDGYYPLAVFTKETGEWLVPLNGLVEKKTNVINSVADLAPVSIKLFSYPEGTVRTSVNQTRPLKRALTAGVSLHLADANKDESVLGVSTQSSPQNSPSPSIVYPKENSIIPGNTPLIRGTAVAGKDVTMLIQGGSKQYSYRTKTDDFGAWLVQYPLALEAGRYTITVNTVDKNGFPVSLKRTFSIIKSGEQVLGIATGSPTLTPTAVPTYINPTSVPTSGVSPTPAPTIILLSPTAILPTRFMPTNSPPVTGGGMSGFLFAALVCIVVGAGLVLAF